MAYALMSCIAMYETHFGLSGRPFAIAPDPDFYFASATHERALSYLRYAALEGSSRVVVTGEIGVGKTLLLQTLQRRLDPRSITVAQLIWPRLGADDLPQALLAAFGIAAGHGEPRAALQAHLAALAADGRRGFVIVDDAHELPGNALHALLRLAAGHGRAMQLALVGQPALRQRLPEDPAYGSCHSVDVFCHLTPFEPAETAAYIEHRLRRVGWEQRPAIPASALEAIQRATGGVPSRINRLCDRLLFSACLDELGTIPAALVERVDGELHVEFDAQRGTSLTKPDALAPEPVRLSIPTLVSVIEDAHPLTRVEPSLYAGPAPLTRSTPGSDGVERDAAAPEVQPARRASRWLRTPAAALLGAAAVALLIGLAAYRDNGDNVPAPLGTAPAPVVRDEADVMPPHTSAPAPAPPAVEALTHAAPTGAGTPAAAPASALSPGAGAPGACTDAVTALGLCAAAHPSDRD